MSSFQQTIIIGYLGAEPQTQYFEGGGQMTRMSVATSESYTSKQTGEKVTKTEWHNVVARNKNAELAEKYLKKGSKVMFVGKNVTRKWQDTEGKDRWTTEVHVRQMTFMDSKGGESQGSEVDAYQNRQGQSTTTPMQDSMDQDDLPF